MEAVKVWAEFVWWVLGWSWFRENYLWVVSISLKREASDVPVRKDEDVAENDPNERMGFQMLEAFDVIST